MMFYLFLLAFMYAAVSLVGYIFVAVGIVSFNSYFYAGASIVIGVLLAYTGIRLIVRGLR